jgi:hypothetical protein
MQQADGRPDLGWPSVSVAFGGNLSPSWLLRRVMPQKLDD